MRHASSPVLCRWVPGTLDQVRLISTHHEQVVSIQEVTRLFGRSAMDDLYLRGTSVQRLPFSLALPHDRAV